MLFEDEYFCVGEEREVKAYRRKLYFTEDDIEIKHRYDSLLPEYQDVVNRVLYELPDDDFFGFNLSRLLEGYKNATPSISLYKISKDMTEFMSQNTVIETASINKQINVAKNREKLQEGEGKSGIESYIQYLCESLLVEDSLLKKGTGKIYTIKEEWYGRFIADVKSSAFARQISSEVGRTWSTLQCVRKYEEYLHINSELREGEGILEEKWAVMTYSGTYQLLSQNSSRLNLNEKKAVDRLINELYIRQLLDGKMPTIEGHI